MLGQTLIRHVGIFALPLFIVGTVRASEPAPLSFHRDVMAVLSKSGCNLGSCHGNANGKGGFKLSLRGQDPLDDFRELTQSLFGRRVNFIEPEASLILLKPTTQVAHQGGHRFERDSLEYEILRQWISEGAQADDTEAMAIASMDVTPLEAVIHAPDREIQLSAQVTFKDGTSRDVTRLAVYEPSNTLPEVSEAGLVTVPQAGETIIMVRYLNHQVPVRLAFVPERPNYEAPSIASHHPIDREVFEKLETLRIAPSGDASDHAYLRRAYLDLTGQIPSVEEARCFINDPASDKRERLIDELLVSGEFADFWALKWSDLLRNEERVLDGKGVARFHRWIRQSIADGKPLDAFVRDILKAEGSTYANPPANFYRANRTPVKRAETAAQVFLGTRLQCAQCHNHPYDRWTQDDYYDWATLFARVDYKVLENRRRDSNDQGEFIGEQVVFAKASGEITNPRTSEDAHPRFLGEEKAVGSDEDRLEALAQWVTSPDNPRFAKTQVNRIWFHLMGRGLIDPVDDFRDTNLPSHPDLLEFLTNQFVESGFNLRHVIRLIMTSRVYQLSAEPTDDNADDQVNYSHIVVRRLTAEQVADSLSRAFGVPLKYAGYPVGFRAAQLPGVGTRFRRDTEADRFLTLFGKPPRLMPSETERADTSTMGQAFELMSGPLIDSLLSENGNRVDRLIQEEATTEAIVDELYWAALSRPPGDEEGAKVRAYVNAAPDRRKAVEDLLWSLVNSKEFVLRY